MGLSINESTGQDTQKKQIVANINYDQNTITKFKKMKKDSDKTRSKQINLYFIGCLLDKI